MDESHVSASRLALADDNEAADADADEEASAKLEEEDEDESMRAAIELNAERATIDLRTRR